MRWVCLAILVLIVTLLLVTVSVAGPTQTWAVVTLPEAHGVNNITFAYDGRQLSLNTSNIGYSYDSGPPIYWSSGASYELTHDQPYAACGTYAADGALTPDPYATFVFTPAWPQSGTMGRVEWAEGTPYGYTAPLVLGNPYAKGQGDATCELLLWYTQWSSGPYYERTSSSVSHTFSATYVPEPAPIVTMLTGCAGIVGLRRRRIR